MTEVANMGGDSEAPASPEQGNGLSAITGFLRLLLVMLWMILSGLFLIPVLILLLPWRRARIVASNFYGKVLGRSVAEFILGCPITIGHKERLAALRPAIYISNHASAYDIFLGMWLCPFRGCGVAKKEIAWLPVFGQCFWLSGHILLNRQKRESAIESLRDMAELMSRYGLSVFLWPEGTRSPDGRLQPFKKGFAHMALATGLPVVPVIVHDAHKVWPKKSLRIHPRPVKIDVLDAISTKDWKAETIEEHIESVMKVFDAALEPHQRRLSEGAEK
jgi:lysophosphatidate acyltransferase